MKPNTPNQTGSWQKLEKRQQTANVLQCGGGGACAPGAEVLAAQRRASRRNVVKQKSSFPFQNQEAKNKTSARARHRKHGAAPFGIRTQVSLEAHIHPPPPHLHRLALPNDFPRRRGFFFFFLSPGIPSSSPRKKEKNPPRPTHSLTHQNPYTRVSFT